MPMCILLYTYLLLQLFLSIVFIKIYLCICLSRGKCRHLLFWRITKLNCQKRLNSQLSCLTRHLCSWDLVFLSFEQWAKLSNAYINRENANKIGFYFLILLVCSCFSRLVFCPVGVLSDTHVTQSFRRYGAILATFFPFCFWLRGASL